MRFGGRGDGGDMMAIVFGIPLNEWEVGMAIRLTGARSGAGRDVRDI